MLFLIIMILLLSSLFTPRFYRRRWFYPGFYRPHYRPFGFGPMMRGPRPMGPGPFMHGPRRF